MSDFESKRISVGQTAIELVNAVNFTRTVVVSVATSTASVVGVGYDNTVTVDNSFTVGTAPVQLYLPAGHALWVSRVGSTGALDVKVLTGAA